MPTLGFIRSNLTRRVPSWQHSSHHVGTTDLNVFLTASLWCLNISRKRWTTFCMDCRESFVMWTISLSLAKTSKSMMPDWRKCWTVCLRAAWHLTLRSLLPQRNCCLGHQGVNKMEDNTAKSVWWWPGLSHDIDQMVKTCPECAKHRKARVEPMKWTPFPDWPRSRIAADFFQHNGKPFLPAIDHYSRDVEIVLVSIKVTAAETAAWMKIFSHHGTADLVVTHNGPQFVAKNFTNSSQLWGFEHWYSHHTIPEPMVKSRLLRTLRRRVTRSTLVFWCMATLHCTTGFLMLSSAWEECWSPECHVTQTNLSKVPDVTIVTALCLSADQSLPTTADLPHIPEPQCQEEAAKPQQTNNNLSWEDSVEL